jgi:ssRNA-specific RNase YbeY (16S rRNA maturation enzyme)
MLHCIDQLLTCIQIVKPEADELNAVFKIREVLRLLVVGTLHLLLSDDILSNKHRLYPMSINTPKRKTNAQQHFVGRVAAVDGTVVVCLGK